MRKQLGVTAFGVNVITIPPGYETGKHLHEEQEELYFVHRGAIEMTFGDGTSHRIEEGGSARVDASTVRQVKNASTSEDAVYLVAGGKDGYVGRDGKQPEGETEALAHCLLGDPGHHRPQIAADLLDLVIRALFAHPLEALLARLVLGDPLLGELS